MDNKVSRTASLQALVNNVEYQTHRFSNGRRIITHQLELDVQSYRKVVARSKTAPKQQVGKVYEWVNSQALAAMIWNRTVQRMQSVGMSTNRLNRTELAFALPNMSHSGEQLAIWDALHFRPMTVTNEQLNSVMPLVRYDETSGAPPVGTHFYIRSWTLSAEELRTVISKLTVKYDEVMEWKRVVDLFSPKPDDPDDLEYTSVFNVADNNTLPSTLRSANMSKDSRAMAFRACKPEFFTIRYVGKVDWPRNPYDRLIEDMVNRTSGILAEFQATLERFIPVVADAAEVHLIRDASLSLDPTLQISSANADLRERFLIDYFDHPTLLNRQHGGYFADYIPSSDDVEAYKAMEINYYHRFHGNAGITPMSMRAEIVQHFKDVQTFANANAGTGTSRHLFTNKLRDVMADQAQPYVYRNSVVPLVILGKDITLENYCHEVSFFDGKSQAGRLTRDLVVKLAALESDYANGPDSWDSQAFNTQLFPFADLWCWLWHQQPVEARSFLQHYLASARPLIAASLGHDVNGVTRANFRHDNGVKAGKLLEVVGVPTIQYYGDTLDEDTAFINIAHWHPGYDKYNANQYKVRRLLDLTWQLTELIGHMAMEFVDNYLKDGGFLPSRLEICENVLEFFEDSKTDAKYQSFFTNFAAAKQDLVKGAFENTDGVRPLLNKEGRLRMAALGQARGEPDSKERKAQVQEYWDKNIPDLHIIIPHQDHLKAAWMAKFLALPTNYFFFMAVVADLPSTDEYVQHLVRTIQPDWANDDSWMKSDEKKNEALVKCGTWFIKFNKDAELQKRKYGFDTFPDEYATAYDLQGRLIGVATNGAIRLRWLRDGGTKVIAVLKQKRAVPTEGEDLGIRTIHFTEHGIDILDAAGRAFKTFFANSNTSEVATIPRAQLAGTEGGPIVLELWKAVRKAHGYEVPEDGPSKNAKAWTVSPGISGIANNANTERPKQNRPPRAGDALYPLQTWLDERFPDGGELRTISAQRIAGSTDDLNAFIAFLKGDEWRRHPYVDNFWLSKLDKIKPENGMLEKNIRILRSTKTDKRQYARKLDLTGQGTQFKETVIIVGPPGSAAANPFPPKGDDDAEDSDGPPKKKSKRKKSAKSDDEEEGGESKKKAAPKKQSKRKIPQDSDDEVDEGKLKKKAAPKKSKVGKADDMEIAKKAEPAKKRKILQDSDDEKEVEKPAAKPVKKLKRGDALKATAAEEEGPDEDFILKSEQIVKKDKKGKKSAGTK